MWKLAELNTRRDMDQLKQMLNKEGCMIDDMDVWIGGNDLADEDTWVWTDGEPVTGGLWGPGQGEGDCMALIGYDWYKKECDGEQGLEMAFMAQKASLPAPRTTTTTTTTTRTATPIKTTSTTLSTVRPTALPTIITTTDDGGPPPTQA